MPLAIWEFVRIKDKVFNIIHVTPILISTKTYLLSIVRMSHNTKVLNFNNRK